MYAFFIFAYMWGIVMGVFQSYSFVIAWWGCGVTGSITQRIADAESHHPQLGVGGRWGRNPAKNFYA